MRFAISLDPAEEGFFSNLKDKFKKKPPKNKNERPSFNSINEAIEYVNQDPKSRYQIILPSCNYGTDCVWGLNFDTPGEIGSTLRSSLVRAYNNANAALPKIRELTAVTFYDNIEDLDEDDQLIGEEQTKKYSREALKQAISIQYITIDVTKANKILVSFDMDSDIAKDDSVLLHMEDVPDGNVRSSDEIDTFY